jgi:UDP-N-acetyl-D-galactosamine dehydrogenase
VADADLRACNLEVSSDPGIIADAGVVIVAVPTPIDDHKTPDLTPVIKASETVGRAMKKGAVVCYESTVYPGVTEEVCVPVLERESGMQWQRDFFVGYSPERINPGDKVHTFATITKVVAGDTPETLDRLAAVYGAAVKAGIHKASCIRVAEAAKVIENTQRDINIALMNELRIIFDKMGISTREVLEAAGTKWNFLGFSPGLVGGHCIGVDPYYLAYKAEEIGHHPQIIMAGRRINDAMGRYFARELIKKMIQNTCTVKGSRVLVLGITFKEDVPDIRNSRVIDIIRELEDFGVDVDVWDPVAYPDEVEEEYGLKLTGDPERGVYEAAVLAVQHAPFVELGKEGISRFLGNEGILYDIKEALGR